MGDEPQRVVITGIDMTVGQMAAYIMRIALAAIPTILLFIALAWLVRGVMWFIDASTY